MRLKIYELNLSKFLSAPGLAQQAALKKTKVELNLLTDIDMLLMVEKQKKVLEEEYVTLLININICYYNKYMKNYDKKKKLSYLQYWDVNNLYRWAMSQKLPVNNFEQINYKKFIRNNK